MLRLSLQFASLCLWLLVSVKPSSLNIYIYICVCVYIFFIDITYAFLLGWRCCWISIIVSESPTVADALSAEIFSS